MSDKGKSILMNLSIHIASETSVPPCSISIGEYNHAVYQNNEI